MQLSKLISLGLMSHFLKRWTHRELGRKVLRYLSSKLLLTLTSGFLCLQKSSGQSKQSSRQEAWSLVLTLSWWHHDGAQQPDGGEASHKAFQPQATPATPAHCCLESVSIAASYRPLSRGAGRTQCGGLQQWANWPPLLCFIIVTSFYVFLKVVSLGNLA